MGQLELLTAGPAVDGSHQAEQVRLFLAGEHDIMQRVFAEEDKDPQVEVCEEGVCVERREGVCVWREGGYVCMEGGRVCVWREGGCVCGE